MPGAATLGDAIKLDGVSRIAAAPRSGSLLAVTADGVRSLSVSQSGAASLSDTALPPGVQPSLIAFSPSGQTAAIYDAASGIVWLLQGNSARPANTNVATGKLVALAASDGSSPAAAALIEGDEHSVFVTDADGHQRLISGFNKAVDVAFVGGTTNLAIADRGAQDLLIVREPFMGNVPETLLKGYVMRLRGSGQALQRTSPAFSEGPLQVASTADGKALAVVAGPGAAGLLDIASGDWRGFGCECGNASLAALNGNAVFRLTDGSHGPVWILDGDSASPRVVFVPPAPPSGVPQ
jgi:DNA-binding beta-propeller fold protein YncE